MNNLVFYTDRFKFQFLENNKNFCFYCFSQTKCLFLSSINKYEVQDQTIKKVVPRGHQQK